jgi:hypothetical protein
MQMSQISLHKYRLIFGKIPDILRASYLSALHKALPIGNYHTGLRV